jgi:hypothetical protein
MQVKKVKTPPADYITNENKQNYYLRRFPSFRVFFKYNIPETQAVSVSVQ